MKRERSWGEWAFLFGIAFAIILALTAPFDQAPWVGGTMALLGLAVGLLNITGKETTGFLIASIALLMVGSAGLQQLPWVGIYLDNILWNISQFVAPAAMIVALKTVFDLARRT